MSGWWNSARIAQQEAEKGATRWASAAQRGKILPPGHPERWGQNGSQASEMLKRTWTTVPYASWRWKHPSNQNYQEVYLLIESRVPTGHGEAGGGHLQQIQGRAWVWAFIVICGIIPHQGTWATQSDSLEIKQENPHYLEEREKYNSLTVKMTPCHNYIITSYHWV